MRTVKEALRVAQQVTGYETLKEYQRQAIEAYLCGKDVFVSAPTEVGKSLTFELAPFALDFKRNGGDKTMVLVVVPLVSLMKDQVYSMQKRGIAATLSRPRRSRSSLRHATHFGSLRSHFGSHRSPILREGDLVQVYRCSNQKRSSDNT